MHVELRFGYRDNSFSRTRRQQEAALLEEELLAQDRSQFGDTRWIDLAGPRGREELCCRQPLHELLPQDTGLCRAGLDELHGLTVEPRLITGLVDDVLRGDLGETAHRGGLIPPDLERLVAFDLGG